jgi:putative membrane protein
MLAAVLAFPALAEDATSAQQTSETTAMAAEHKLDAAFAKDAAKGGLMEVTLGGIAVERAASAEVKAFGQRMVDDHSAANEKLKSIAEAKQIELPTELDGEKQQLVDKLSALSGAEFDQAYMQEMVSDHEKDVEHFRAQAEQGQDAELKTFAAQTLPTLEEHLQHARDTASAVGVAATETTGSGDETVMTAAQDAGQQPDASASGEAASDEASMAQDADQRPAVPSTDDTASAEVTVSAGVDAAQPATEATDDSASTVARAESGDAALQMTAEQLIGQDIVNANGDTLGEIEDIVLDQDKAVFVLVDVGGFLGMGEKRVALPFSHLAMGDDEAVLLSQATEDELKGLPEWEEGSAGYAPFPRDQRVFGDEQN